MGNGSSRLKALNMKNRATSAISTTSKKSARSLSTASQRSFKMNKGMAKRASENHLGATKFKKNFTQSSNLNMQKNHLGSKYIKNVMTMNIPDYLQDKTGLTSHQNLQNDSKMYKGTLLQNNSSIEENFLDESQLLNDSAIKAMAMHSRA